MGAVLLAVAFCEAMNRSGEDGLRVRGKLVEWGSPNIGEPLRSVARGVWSVVSVSPISLISLIRLGNPGNTSSAGFLGVRTRLGEPSGLEGRCGEMSRWPAALKPGKLWALDIAGARAPVEDFDRKWPRA